MINTGYDLVSFTKKEEHLFLKTIIGILRPLKYLHFSKTPSNQEELHKAYVYTIKMHSLEKKLEGYYLKGAFWELAKFDKINTHKNEPYLVKLDRLFHTLKVHIKLKNKIESAHAFSTIKTTYSTHSNFIQPTINAYETTLEDDIDNESINNKIKLLNAYKKEPLAVSMAIQASTNNQYDFLFEAMNKKEFQDLSKRITSFKLKLSKKDIAKSLQLHITSIYKEDSIYNQLMGDMPKVTKSKLLLYAHQISKMYIDMNSPRLNIKNIDAKVNNIEFFEDIVIMQPTTTKIKEPKINSYEELISNPNWIL